LFSGAVGGSGDHGKKTSHEIRRQQLHKKQQANGIKNGAKTRPKGRPMNALSKACVMTKKHHMAAQKKRNRDALKTL